MPTCSLLENLQVPPLAALRDLMVARREKVYQEAIMPRLIKALDTLGR